MNNRKRRTAVLSTKYPQFSEALKKRGYAVFGSELIDCLIPYERDHADMQCLILDDTAFVAAQCTEMAQALSEFYHIVLCANAIGGTYPANIALNCAVIGKNVIAREDAVDPLVRAYCCENGYQVIPVRQGYAKCSCAVVSDHAVITADEGIFRSLKETKIDVLLIGQGRVRLEGADYGFIGGASGLAVAGRERILYFCGSIERHPDYRRIREFCGEHGTTIESLTDDELTDIGGILFC